MTRRRAVLAAAWAVLIAGPTLFGPAVAAVRGHSQLVSSTPGSGEVVTQAPAELRLVFSEPIDGHATHVDLLDATGRTLARAIGAPDPADPYSLIAPIGPLADGLYTVNWQALSAADGHQTSGFFTFGVGNVTAPPSADAGAAGSIHSGHDAGTALLETQSRFLADSAFLLAFGLAVIGWLVLRWPPPSSTARLIAGSLVAGAIGSAGLMVLAGATPGLDPIAYATGSRTGILLLARTVIGVAGAAVVVAVARRRSGLATVAGGIAALGGLGLVAAGGHAAAYSLPVPLAAMVVHLATAGTWLAGLVTIAWMALVGVPGDPPLRIYVARFSAVALVSVALLALSGVYADWIQTRSLLSLATDYQATLAVKVALALGAFTLGAVHYLTSDRAARFARTVVVECGLAGLILVATALLASGSPPGQEQPIAIAPAVSSAVSTGSPPVFEVAPGRPGPTRFVVLSNAVPAGGAVELQLTRLDTAAETRIHLHAVASPGQYAADGGQLAANSRWDATVVTRNADGSEVARSRYAFALDATGISEGQQLPSVDPSVIVGIALLVLGVVSVAFALGGGSLPRVEATTGRLAMLAGSAIGGALGLLILLDGPRL